MMRCRERYGYDIQCELVGETGVARLPEPSNVLLRRLNGYAEFDSRAFHGIEPSAFLTPPSS
jgi:hypothetical protein